MAVEFFVWHEPNYRFVFQSWEGIVGRHVNGICEQTLALGATFVTDTYAGESTRSGSGRLVASFEIDRGHARNGDVKAGVGANPRGRLTGYAYFQHEGTGIHSGRGLYPIRPRAGGHLRFYWRRVGRVVVRQQVSHPGVPATKYLTRALAIAMR
jgi:hypothetical protein